MAFEQKILDEDLAAAGAYVERSLPLDLTAEVHTKADRMTIEYRRMLADLLAAADDAGSDLATPVAEPSGATS